jgi:hypothetical protein
VAPQIDGRLLSRLKNSGGIVDYQDPAAKFDDSGQFSGEWIAAMHHVDLQAERAQSSLRGKSSPIGSNVPASDLWVLVQESGAAVAEPVTRLGSRLQRESYVALGSLLALVMILWYFVFRLSQARAAAENTPKATELPATALQSTVDASQPLN